MTLLKSKHANLINNKWVSSRSSFQVTNPLTNKNISTVSTCNLTQINSAIKSSQNAFLKWKKLSIKKRSTYLINLSNLIKENTNKLANIIVAEQGKPIKEAIAEINYANSFITSGVNAGLQLKGDLLNSHFENKQGHVYHEPYGVIGCITPWNFPAAMITRKIAPALITGNTVILKPSEHTPLTALAIGELAIKSGLPAGVLNILCGDAIKISDRLLTHSDVKKISFTGSTKTGKSLLDRASTTITKLSLELGGHAPFIVFNDADIDLVITAAIQSKFRNCGQTCICANRFYIQDKIYPEFVKRLHTKINELNLGNGQDKTTHLGPLINQNAIKKIEDQIKDALNKGATLICGGKKYTHSKFSSAHFFEPTLLTNCTDNMKIFTEETFGPVCAIKQFNNESDVINDANNSIYGLAAYAFTTNLKRTFKLSKELNYPIIGINDGSPSHPEIPFGGFNQSGMGKEGGSYALAEYTQLKYVSFGLQ